LTNTRANSAEPQAARTNEQTSHTGLPDASETTIQLENCFPSQMNSGGHFELMNETDNSIVCSQDVHPYSELSLPKQLSCQGNENEAKVAITVVLNHKVARNITFAHSTPLAFEIRQRLEELLSPEDFRKYNLPTSVANIRLERWERRLLSGDVIKDGDVIYATSELTND